MNVNQRKWQIGNFLGDGVRGCLAIALSLLLVSYGQPVAYGQEAPPPPPGNYAPLGVEELNQMVAPIALYPDSLVAQVLTAATYPQQVSEASNWLAQSGGMPPEQLAAAANSMPWDPSVKALTAFPSVLNNMARNYNWTAALGNAYYNQPGDVMNAVQAMRMRAQEAGALRSDAHYRVLYNGGIVAIEPVNPAFVYVPYYNPWTVYGGPIAPWGGYYYVGPPRGVVLATGLAIGFAAGISTALFSHYGWGYHAWAPNWHGGVVVYNHTTYISRSTTVINRGYFGGHNRGVYEHPGPGVPRNFRPPVTAQSAAFRPGQGRPGEFRGSNYGTGRPQGEQTPAAGRQFGRPTEPVRPQAPPNAQGGRQFGQPRPQMQTNRPAPAPAQGNYSRTQGQPQERDGGRRPQTQMNQPAPAQGNYSRTPGQPQERDGGRRPQTQMNQPAPAGGGNNRPQTSAPAHQPSNSHQESSGGGNRSEQHSDRRR